MTSPITILIILFGLFGLSISAYIYSKKKQKKSLICPRRSTCDTVIHSDYSRILGIPVEILGMGYYAFIICSYVYFWVARSWSTQFGFVLLGVSMCSLLFSIYLVSIQAFIVRHWCIWCLSSALASLAIFILSYWHYLSY